jgi:hypothetical protein
MVPYLSRVANPGVATNIVQRGALLKMRAQSVLDPRSSNAGALDGTAALLRAVFACSQEAAVPDATRREQSNFGCCCRRQPSTALIGQCAGSAHGCGRTSGTSYTHWDDRVFRPLVCCSPLDHVNADLRQLPGSLRRQVGSAAPWSQLSTARDVDEASPVGFSPASAVRCHCARVLIVHSIPTSGLSDGAPRQFSQQA